MNMNHLKIGFIGFGNMAQAITNGWILSKEIQPTQLYASARDQEKLVSNTDLFGIHPIESNERLIDTVDIVVLAVKPYQINKIISPLKEMLKNKIVISVAVNHLFDDFSQVLLSETEHLSILPNTPVTFRDGVVLFEEKHSLTDQNLNLVRSLFDFIGHVEMIPTDQMSIAGIITGSAPAFVDLFIEALSDAAVKQGLDRKTSYRLISQMIRGTANLQLKTGEHPGILKDDITSPGGTTIKGIARLEKDGFRGSIIEAVDKILEH